MMGTAISNGPDRARIAAEQAVACPLLEGIDLSGARGVLVLITAAKGSLKLAESKQAMNTIRAYASPDAHVIYGTAYDDDLNDQIRVTVVATGLSRQGARRVAPPLQVLRTGTDNAPISTPHSGQASSPMSMPMSGPVMSPAAAPAMGAQVVTSPLAQAMTPGALPGSPMATQAPGMAQPDYAAMATPSVWRTRDRTQAAAKVDALSSGGMDDFEIPAFLRKQAD
jgi:cell division protein FtsZ